MVKIFNKLVTIVCLFVLVVSGISCASKQKTPEVAKQVATVQRGNLTIAVSVDGNLVMPQAFDLLFGAPGDVKDVLVEEGDFVTEGTILARLDDTTQRLDVQSSNNNVQTVLSNLYEVVPRLPQFPSTFYDVATTPPVSTSETVTTEYTIVDPTVPVPTPTPLPTLPKTETVTKGTTPGTITTTTTTTTTTIATHSGTVVTTPGPDTIPIITPVPPPPLPIIVPPGPIIITGTTTIGTTSYTTVTTTKTVDTSVTTTTVTARPEGSILGYPVYYPNSAALTSFVWTQNEVYQARELFRLNKYAESASELEVAVADLELCMKIIENTINNPKSGLGNTAPFVPNDEAGITYFQIQQDQSFESVYIVQLRSAVDLIRRGQADIETVRGLTAEGKYEEASQMFDTLLKRVNDIGKVVINNINVIETHNYGTIYGEDISLYLYGAAEDRLNKAFTALGKDGLDSPEFKNNLRIAQDQMALCNSILGSNHYVLQHGLSLKSEQQYNVDLAKALVALGNSKDNFLKTAILAPFDGTVVSVGVKKNDVLSAMDYSSKVAVQLVDTSQIKFQGQVDEIDILKIKTGQKATISVDAVPDKTFTGTVSFISPYGTADTNNVVKFPVTIKLDPTDVALKGSLTATADISIYSVEKVLLVPLSAVTTTSAGTFVTIVNEATGQQEKRQVTIGNKNLQFAEVLSGLREGDKVIVEDKVTGAPVVTGFPRGPSGGGPPPSR